jgi:membrane-associated phospholipid phosphatase
MTSEIISEKKIILTARIMSMIFTPFYLPLIGLIALFVFSYMNRLPLSYILTVLAMVYLCTILLPSLLIHLFRRYQGWTPMESAKRESRIVPYIISIVCYFVCYYLMTLLQMPSFIGRIVMAALLIQVICVIINIWWKISTHTAGIGGVTGGIMAFALFFDFNPLWWLSLVFIIAGMVGTSRIILRQHSLSQVLGGFGVGLITAFIVIL